MAMITAEQVAAAYAALATGQRDQIAQLWAEDMRWLVPGHNQLSGWKNNLDEFIQFMGTVGRLSDNSFRMDSMAVMTADNFSADVTHNTGNRAGHAMTNKLLRVLFADPDAWEWVTCATDLECRLPGAGVAAYGPVNAPALTAVA